MTDLFTVVAILGFVAFIVAVARLGSGVDWDIGSIFGRPGVIDRAHGVQENDLPPFRFGAQPA